MGDSACACYYVVRTRRITDVCTYMCVHTHNGKRTREAFINMCKISGTIYGLSDGTLGLIQVQDAWLIMMLVITAAIIIEANLLKMLSEIMYEHSIIQH